MVSLPWTITGSIFLSGSFAFQSGTVVDTGSFIIDEVMHTISFIIPSLPPGWTEVFVFDSRASGPVGTTIGTQITATSAENISTTTLSNLLTIVAPLASVGSGGG